MTREVEGHMIVGAWGSDITLPDHYKTYTDWAEDKDLFICSTYYDADFDDCIYGYRVDDVEVIKADINWLNHIQYLGEKFLELTGVEATLFGASNVY